MPSFLKQITFSRRFYSLFKGINAFLMLVVVESAWFHLSMCFERLLCLQL